MNDYDDDDDFGEDLKDEFIGRLRKESIEKIKTLSEKQQKKFIKKHMGEDASLGEFINEIKCEDYAYFLDFFKEILGEIYIMDLLDTELEKCSNDDQREPLNDFQEMLEQ